MIRPGLSIREMPGRLEWPLRIEPLGPDATIGNLRYDEFNKLLGARLAGLRDNQAEPTTGWLNALRADLQAIADQPRQTGIGGR